MKRCENLPFRALLVVGCLLVGLPSDAAEPKLACTLQTEYVKWAISADGRSVGWVDLRDQQDYCPASHPPVATVKKAGLYHAATVAELKDGLLELRFVYAGVQAVLRATAKPHYLLVEVVSLDGRRRGGTGLRRSAADAQGAAGRAAGRLRLGLEPENQRPRVAPAEQPTAGGLLSAVRLRRGPGGPDRLPARQAPRGDAGGRVRGRGVAQVAAGRSLGPRTADQPGLLPVQLRRHVRGQGRGLDQAGQAAGHDADRLSRRQRPSASAIAAPIPRPIPAASTASRP